MTLGKNAIPSQWHCFDGAGRGRGREVVESEEAERGEVQTILATHRGVQIVLRRFTSDKCFKNS
jgi:hypothetical protein